MDYYSAPYSPPRSPGPHDDAAPDMAKVWMNLVEKPLYKVIFHILGWKSGRKFSASKVPQVFRSAKPVCCGSTSASIEVSFAQNAPRFLILSRRRVI
jgi:hypothetical protein